MIDSSCSYKVVRRSLLTYRCVLILCRKHPNCQDNGSVAKTAMFPLSSWLKAAMTPLSDYHHSAAASVPHCPRGKESKHEGTGPFNLVQQHAPLSSLCSSGSGLLLASSLSPALSTCLSSHSPPVASNPLHYTAFFSRGQCSELQPHVESSGHITLSAIFQ